MTARLVVCDSIENIGGRSGRKQTGEIDPPQHTAGGGINSDDPVCEPDVRVDFTVDEFDLVDICQWCVRLVVDTDGPHGLESRRIEEPYLVRSIAHDQMLIVVRKAPSLTGVKELSDEGEGCRVVYERRLRLPC